MKYIVKEPPVIGLTRDAESLMREFNRAMGAVYDSVDQNNVMDKAIHPKKVVSPVSAWEASTAIYGKRLFHPFIGLGSVQGVKQGDFFSQVLDAPEYIQSGGREFRGVDSFWTGINEDASGKKLQLPLSLQSDVMGTIMVSGQFDLSIISTIGFKRTMALDARITDNGMPFDHMSTVSCFVDGGYLPFFCSYRGLVSAGDHLFGVEARDRSEPSVSGTTLGSVAKHTSIYFYGFTR